MVQSREERLAYKRQYYKDHHEKVLAYAKQYNKDNREKIKQYHKEHCEEKKQYDKQYHKDHREEVLEKSKQYYEKHSEKIKIQHKQYREDNREKINIYIRQWHKDHPELNLISQKKRLTKLCKTFDMDYEVFRYALMSWSQTVKKRDGHKCTWCNSTEKLVAHHIWHKAFCPESALDVDNGVTLCNDCHMEQHRLDRS